MSLQKQYSTFTNNIKLTSQSAKYKEARDNDDKIKAKIEAAFEEAGYDIKRSFLQGSLATFTGVLPIDGDFDIDRAIVISKASAPKNPVDAKKVVKKTLKAYGFSEPDIKRPCITADYKSKNIHIDYVVYQEDKNKNLELAVGKEFSQESERFWDPAEPEELKDWLTWKEENVTDKERQQFYRLVRILKRWRDENYSDKTDRKKVFSIALAIMVRNEIDFHIDDKGNADDHAALLSTLSAILKAGRYFTSQGDDEYTISVKIPVKPKRNVFKPENKTVATALRKKLKALQTALKDVNKASNLDKKCELLRDVFGNDFPEASAKENQQHNGREQTSQKAVVPVSKGA